MEHRLLPKIPHATALLTAAALLLGAGPAPGPASTPSTARGFPSARGADVAAPRTDNNSRLAHEQLLDKAKLGKGKIDIYFEGDSIFRRWGAADYPQYLAHWKENFFGWNAADFGWGADRIENILWRLDNGELDGVHPKIIVILAGTNNLNARQGDANVADISKGLRAIVDLCRKKAPDSTIVLLGILPRNDVMADLPIINKVNANLAQMADGKSLRCLNVNDRLADKDGKLFDGMMNRDRLHPDIKGYQVIADALKPIFTEILGPPAKEDHAPPPTGDPSAAGRSNQPAPAR